MQRNNHCAHLTRGLQTELYMTANLTNHTKARLLQRLYNIGSRRRHYTDTSTDAMIGGNPSGRLPSS